MYYTLCVLFINNKKKNFAVFSLKKLSIFIMYSSILNII